MDDQFHGHHVYRRYWDYYGRVMEWKRRQQTAWWKAKFAAERCENEVLHQHRDDHVDSSWRRSDDRRPLIDMPMDQSGKRSDVMLDRQQDVVDVHGHVSQSNDDVDDDDDDDDLVFEMEVSEEMLAFLEKSDLHRRQLKAEREAAARTAEQVKTSEDDHHCGPPSEQPGARRTAEMKQLYGRRAATIHGMETAVQLSFHRNCDYFQPKLWPNMPIRLQFK